MKGHQEKFLTAVVLTLTIALFSTNFLDGEEQVKGNQNLSPYTITITNAQNL